MSIDKNKIKTQDELDEPATLHLTSLETAPGNRPDITATSPADAVTHLDGARRKGGSSRKAVRR